MNILSRFFNVPKNSSKDILLKKPSYFLVEIRANPNANRLSEVLSRFYL